MTEAEILALLKKFADFMSQSNFLTDGFRKVGMWLITCFTDILNGLSHTLVNLIQLLDIFDNSAFQDIVNKLEPIKWALLVLALIGFFVLLAFNRVKNAGEIPSNLYMILLLTLILPFIFGQLSHMSQSLFKDLINDGQTPGTQIILDNTTDLLAVAEEGWQLKPNEHLNHYKEIRQIDVNEKITSPESIKHGEVFGYQLSTDAKGKEVAVEIPQPSGLADYLAKDVFKANYYRNHINFLQIILVQLISIIALVITSFKFAIIINKMFGDYVLLVTAGFADMATMQRVKSLLGELIGSLALIVYIPVLFQIYLVAVQIIQSYHFDFWTYLIAFAGASWALIDGPNGFQRVTGIDAGLRSTWALGIGALAASTKLGGALSKATGKVVRSAANSIGEVGAFGLGYFSDKDKNQGINQRESSQFTNNDKEYQNDRENTQNNQLISDRNEPNQNETIDELVNQNQPPIQPDNATYTDDGTPFSSINDSEINGDSSLPQETDKLHSPNMTQALEDIQEKGISAKHSPFDITQEDIQKMNADEDKYHSRSQARNKYPIEELKNHEKMSALKQNNPLKPYIKNKVLGFDMDDQRRYTKQTYLERKTDTYNVGKNYRKYRELKKRLAKETKNHKEGDN